MTSQNPARPRATVLFTSIAIAAVLLSACMPIAPWTIAEGGPNPPLDKTQPLVDPASLNVRASATPVVVAMDIEQATGTPSPTVTASPTDAATPTDVATPTPTPTPVAPAEAISMQEALNCLAAGRVVYGLALQNTNVRQEPDVAACRIGRIPKGSLVRITGSLDLENPSNTIAFATVTPSPEPVEVVASATQSDIADNGNRVQSLLFADKTATPTSTPRATATRAPTVTATVTATATPTDAPDHQITNTPSFGYVEDIQPLFSRTCNSCHSGIVKSNDLQVTEYDPLMAGGTNGPAVHPGNAKDSLLWQMIESGRMPMVGELNGIDKAMVRDWIDAGAPEYRPTPVATATPKATTTPERVATTTPQSVTIDVVDEETTATPTPFVVVSAQPAAPATFTFALLNGRQNETDGKATTLLPAPFAASDASWGQWLTVESDDYDTVADSCQDAVADPASLVSSELILPVACGLAPSVASLDLLRVSLALPVSAPAVAATSSNAASTSAASTSTEPSSASTSADEPESATTGDAEAIEDAGPEVAASAPAAIGDFSASAAGITAPALGVAAPADADGWLTPRGGYCIDRRLASNDRGITALAFAPDGTLYMALDSKLTGEVDPMILNDAFHPSRSVAVYDPASDNRPVEILSESPRITGLDYENGILWVSRSGEVGMIPDGGAYETLAGGFAVDSHLYHANNGIVASNGYVYVSAGGVRDGYYEGPMVGLSVDGAQSIVSGGNPWAARIVRAPIDQLLSTRSINAFTTAAKGVRNPYGITVDPSGDIWWTDNGATNVPEGVRAGDEVDMMNPANAGNGDANAPYYGFPLAIMEPQDWYLPPVANLVNTAAPTGISWAMGTIFFAQYGRDPGLYRLGESNGTVVAERVLLGWPILAVTTAPDGALWIGMGDGGLFRVTSGCNN